MQEIIYRTKKSNIKLRLDSKTETIWMSQKQIAQIFGVSVQTVNEHVKNVLKKGEFDKNSVIRKFRITADDGKKYSVKHYNRDLVLSVGYHIDSKQATKFRKWSKNELNQLKCDDASRDDTKKLNQNLKSIITVIVATLLGFGLSLAGSFGAKTYVVGLPLFAFGVILAFAINWLVFIPSFIFKTEKFYDLTGSLSYFSVIISAFFLNPVKDARSILILISVLVWAGRLGTYLFLRILKDGKDKRFDQLKTNLFSFLVTWTLQGLWVAFTLAAALAAITSAHKQSFDIFAIIGLIIWLIGFSFEAIADYQKSVWRKDPKNKGKFINVGLWSKSRHPNYFGEITLWTGMAIIALPNLQSWQYLTLVSPIFVATLIIKISGLPMLESYADKKWGKQKDYQQYKKNTPILIPKI